ncbi:hypothetical protein O6H91_19G081700 [Diphasiastrum complanatum]|uniref:Uncharacterized protein n=1 Tax=Diphasiastrum complanatum TaxID=34168 RepID=A0ACC2AXB0_DIPCM|nr:hypothetical protein O6H91_Y517300 [Diphasiastrum complanatum]KAJ7289979.1 hypothetical protein O6H91_Y300300 [Diphasiastrum complanatum]KAJ7522060.1 hypothetical protein O6H91_19G081700 [Diphasiastrum complanatum]
MESRHRPQQLRISKESHRIRKSSCPLPSEAHRPPVIIHTHPPKVIYTDPHNFMSLVQRLTGSFATRKKCHTDNALNSSNSADGSCNNLTANSHRCISAQSLPSSDSSRYLFSPKPDYFSKYVVLRDEFAMEGENQAASEVSQSNSLPIPSSSSPDRKSQSAAASLPCIQLSANTHAQLDNSSLAYTNLSPGARVAGSWGGMASKEFAYTYFVERL